MLHERIKALRLSYGMNQVAFGKRLNATKQSVCNWENSNIQPSIDMPVKSACVFSACTGYLPGLDDRKYVDATGLTADQTAHRQCIRKIFETQKSSNIMVLLLFSCTS